MTQPASVGIIMRSKDEQPYAERALEALSRQTVQDYALYAVDSGSTDGTLEVVKSHAPAKLVQIAPEAYVPGRVLNRMVEQTREATVVLLNADAIPLDPRWLETLVEPIRNGTADATMSHQSARQDARFVVRYDYARAFDPANIRGENADFFSAVASAFRRSLWDQHKFRTEGYAEDLDWARRCRLDGARFLLVPESRVEHSHNYSLRGLYRKKFRHGQAYVHIFGPTASFPKQAVACARELVRDTLYAVRRGRLDTIPYNTLYRTIIHWEIGRAHV